MKRFACLTLLAALFASPVAADRISLVADEWCPYNCTPGSDRPGYLVEVARLALAEAGHRVVYHTIPWNRAITAVREGDYDGLIGAGRRETPDFVFPSVPLAVARHTLYPNSWDTWTYRGYDSLEGVRLAVIKDYSYGRLYENYILPNEGNRERVTILYGENVIARLIALLQHGRVDTFIEDEAVFERYLNVSGAPGCFRKAGVVHEEEIYIAFSPALAKSQQYARELAAGLRQLRASGRLEPIRDAYFASNRESPICD